MCAPVAGGAAAAAGAAGREGLRTLRTRLRGSGGASPAPGMPAGRADARRTVSTGRARPPRVHPPLVPGARRCRRGRCGEGGISCCPASHGGAHSFSGGGVWVKSPAFSAGRDTAMIRWILRMCRGAQARIAARRNPVARGNTKVIYPVIDAGFEN